MSNPIAKSDLLSPPNPLPEHEQKVLRVQRLLVELDQCNAALAEGLDEIHEIQKQTESILENVEAKAQAQKKSLKDTQKREEKKTRILVVALLILTLFAAAILALTFYYLKLI